MVDYSGASLISPAVSACSFLFRAHVFLTVPTSASDRKGSVRTKDESTTPSDGSGQEVPQGRQDSHAKHRALKPTFTTGPEQIARSRRDGMTPTQSTVCLNHCLHMFTTVPKQVARSRCRSRSDRLCLNGRAFNLVTLCSPALGCLFVG